MGHAADQRHEPLAVLWHVRSRLRPAAALQQLPRHGTQWYGAGSRQRGRTRARSIAEIPGKDWVAGSREGGGRALCGSLLLNDSGRFVCKSRSARLAPEADRLHRPGGAARRPAWNGSAAYRPDPTRRNAPRRAATRSLRAAGSIVRVAARVTHQ
jgi:hypothetical protein